jgi:hypothetical protein
VRNPYVLGNGEYEELVLDRVVAALTSEGRVVTGTEKADIPSDRVGFDWLIRIETGACIALEVVRAEDEGQMGHVGRELKAGKDLITGTAEMPWDSLRRVLNKKRTKASGYRDLLDRRCHGGQLHLAITSGLQDLVSTEEMRASVEGIAREHLDTFDAIWLVQRGFAYRVGDVEGLR